MAIPIRDVLQPLEFSFCFLRCSVRVSCSADHDRSLQALERDPIRVEELVEEIHTVLYHGTFLPYYFSLFQSETPAHNIDFYQTT